VGLRPYTSKAKILPEQTIGRGLRRMFATMNAPYTERVDIIGNPAFLKFVEQLEHDEDITLDTFDLKEPLVITTIEPDPDKLDRDIAVPTLSPILARKKTLAEEIAALDVVPTSTQEAGRRRREAIPLRRRRHHQSAEAHRA
jgi:type III restriction enzyme